MAKSVIEICNRALSTLGQRLIISLDSTSSGDNAALCKSHYDSGQRLLLSKADWPFARSRDRLTKLAEPTVYLRDGEACYALPNLCIRPLRLLAPYDRAEWQLCSEGVITVDAGTDSSSYPVMVFTKEILDPSRFSESFSELLVAYLVAKLAGPIAGATAKEVASYNAMFMSQVDMYSPLDLNQGQGWAIADSEAEFDAFNLQG